MKTKVYTITHSSYEELDNYLFSDSRTTGNRIEAIKLYEEWRDSSREYAKGDDDEYEIAQTETSITECGREYEVSRGVGTENGYQAIIRLSVTELSN